MKLQVETGAENEEPVRFFLGSRPITVIDVIDRWPGVDHAYFKVGADDRNIYILRLDQNTGSWEMIYFQAENQS